MHPDIDPSFERFVGEELRALPAESTPPYDWTEFRRRARARARAQERIRRGSRVAVAASCATLLVSLALLAHWLWSREGPGEIAARASWQAPPREATSRMEAPRRWLASLPDDQAIVRVSSRVPILDLEDRIAVMDDALNAARLGNARPGHVLALQRERAELLQSLVQVRYAETLAAEAP
jgi:hypothetical protein